MSGIIWADIFEGIHKGEEIKMMSFRKSLSSTQRLAKLKEKQISTDTVWELVKGLLSLNKTKLSLSLFFFILRLALTIVTPFFFSFLKENFTQPSESVSMIHLLLMTLGYKLFSSLVWVFCDFFYSNLGIEYFAYLYWLILDKNNSRSINMGKMVNIVEYDCNLLSNIVYSSLTTIFYSIELMVLFGLLIHYLINCRLYSVFAIIICCYVICQGLTSMGIFILNRKYISLKDKRLSGNIQQEEMSKTMNKRKKQQKANKNFLIMRMISKLITLLFPILLNIYIFLIANRTQIKDNEYTILILVNLIRNPISQLMLALNLNAQILNSCRRIVQALSEQKNESFSSKLLGSQSINEQINFRERQIVRERGNIDFQFIYRSLISTINFKYLFFLVFSLLCLLGSRYYSNYITKQMLAENYSPFFYISLVASVGCPIIFYSILIFSLQKLAHSIFTKLKPELSYEALNRLSGDIAAVDRSATINLYEICFSLMTLIGSYLYSIISLDIGWLQCILSIFLSFCLWIAFRLNRFVMASRRQVFRNQLHLKSGILSGLLHGESISTSEKMKQSWLSIFECKQMGLFIQNYYMLMVSAIMLILSLLFIVLSVLLVENQLTKSILLMVCLTIDRDMLLLFFALVRLELSFVSFERVLNVLTN